MEGQATSTKPRKLYKINRVLYSGVPQLDAFYSEDQGGSTKNINKKRNQRTPEISAQEDDESQKKQNKRNKTIETIMKLVDG